MSQEVIFRCDKTNEIGGGHLLRCLALAEYFEKEKNIECVFLGKYIRHEIFFQELESKIIDIGSKNHINKIPKDPKWIVIDHYGIGFEEESEFKKSGAKIVVIDDMPNRKHNADILIDQTLNRKEDEYYGLVAKETHILAGTDYAMLRSQFRKLKNSSRVSNDKRTTILISLGLSQLANIEESVIAGLNRINKELNIILLSETKSHCLEKLIYSSQHDIRRPQISNNIASLLLKSDFVVGAAGNSSWERCCLGIPTGLIILADNQRNNAEALSHEGAADIIGYGSEISDEVIYQYFSSVLENNSKLKRMEENACNLCDGNGVERIYNAMCEAN